MTLPQRSACSPYPHDFLRPTGGRAGSLSSGTQPFMGALVRNTALSRSTFCRTLSLNCRGPIVRQIERWVDCARGAGARRFPRMEASYPWRSMKALLFAHRRSRAAPSGVSRPPQSSSPFSTWPTSFGLFDAIARQSCVGSLAINSRQSRFRRASQEAGCGLMSNAGRKGLLNQLP